MTSVSETAGLERSRSAFSLWPRRILGPPPSLKELNLICWGLFVAFLLIPVCAIQWIHSRQGTGSIRQLNSDFVYFYGDGEIAHRYGARLIYDIDLQQRVFSSIYPPRDGYYSPSPYPPFVPLFFRAFTYLSFESAFLVWMAISLALYLTGIAAASRTVFPREPLKVSLILCFALAFFPFVFGTLLNGQLAAVAVCSIGLAVYQEKAGNPFRSGLALALLAYKPTLLLLVFPMLLFTRRFKALGGFLTGAAALALVSTAFAGAGIWPVYVGMLRHFSRASGVSGASHMQVWKYVDLNSFFAAIPGGRSGPALAILGCIVAAGAICLALLLWKSAKGAQPVQWLAWGAVLTWTLLLNVYVPIYDSVLVVIAVALTLGALHELGWGVAAQWTTLLAVIVFAASWKTESFAKTHSVQLLSIALFALGMAQLAFLRSTTRQRE